MRQLLALASILASVATLFATPAATAQPTPFTGRPQAFERAPAAKVVGVYVPNWEPVALVDAIKPGSISHLLYAFLRICGPGQLAKDAAPCAGRPEFALTVGPKEAEFDAAFRRLKQREPGVRVVASVGGWGGSDPFFHLAAEAPRRAAFVGAVVDFLRGHAGFDGIDIDWEHPGNNGAANGVQLGGPADGQGYADLMSELRAAVDALGRETGRRYLVTTAVNPTRPIVDRINFRQAGAALDLVFMMTYDFYGGWSDRAGNHATLRSSAPEADDSLERAVRNLTAAGVPAGKLVAGVAMYGRGFAGVKAPTTGAAKTGVWPPEGPGSDAGSIVYKRLAAELLGPRGQGLRGFKPVFDPVTQAWNLWRAADGLFVGYDDPRAVEAKGRYARAAGLAGVFAWELSQDNGDILNAMNRGVGNRARRR